MTKHTRTRPTAAITRAPVIRVVFRALLAVSLLALTACAATGPQTHPVVEGAQARWNAVLSHGFYP